LTRTINRTVLIDGQHQTAVATSVISRTSRWLVISDVRHATDAC